MWAILWVVGGGFNFVCALWQHQAKQTCAPSLTKIALKVQRFTNEFNKDAGWEN